MCNPASLVITKDAAFWSMNTDSHEDIITEHGLSQDGVRGPNILRVEITPPDGDFSAPATEWRYKLDQDIMPPWHDAAEDEKRARVALTEWIAARVIREGAKKVCSGRFFVSDSATVRASGSATVEAYDSATVRASDSATVRASGSATVRASGSATVEASGSATVNQYGGIVNPPTDNAVVIDRRGNKPVCITA